jgi:threonyl-tRNA synthetase
LEEEIINMHNMFFKEVYNVLGFSIDNCEMYLSLRPSNRIGSDEK